MQHVHYGKPYSQCSYCGKYVKLSGFFAGIHVCVSDEDIARIDRQRAAAHKQSIEAQVAKLRVKYPNAFAARG